MINFNKAQSETIGIAIVVFLLIILMIFVFYLNSLKKPLDLGETSLLANNFLNALIDTTTSCNNQTIINLIDDCVYDKKFSCPESSCDFVKKIISDLLNNVFGVKNIKYYFILSGNEDLNVNFGNACLEDRETGYYSYNSYGKNIELKLQLCK